MDTPEEQRYDEIAATVIRGMRPELAAEFLASPEWRNIPAELRERVSEADARLTERQRRNRHREETR